MTEKIAYTAPEVADLLSLSPVTVRRHTAAEAGELREARKRIRVLEQAADLLDPRPVFRI